MRDQRLVSFVSTTVETLAPFVFATSQTARLPKPLSLQQQLLSGSRSFSATTASQTPGAAFTPVTFRVYKNGDAEDITISARGNVLQDLKKQAQEQQEALAFLERPLDPSERGFKKHEAASYGKDILQLIKNNPQDISDSQPEPDTNHNVRDMTVTSGDPEVTSAGLPSQELIETRARPAIPAASRQVQ